MWRVHANTCCVAVTVNDRSREESAEQRVGTWQIVLLSGTFEPVMSLTPWKRRAARSPCMAVCRDIVIEKSSASMKRPVPSQSFLGASRGVGVLRFSACAACILLYRQSCAAEAPRCLDRSVNSEAERKIYIQLY